MDLKLQILRQDILDTRYHNAEDCAITRALARAGYPKLRDTGFAIKEKGSGKRVYTYTDADHDNLSLPLLRMYKSLGKAVSNIEPLEPADFTYTLNIPDHG